MASQGSAIPSSNFTNQIIEKRTISGILRPDFAKRAEKRKYRDREASSTQNNDISVESDGNEVISPAIGIHTEHFGEDASSGMTMEPRHGATPSVNPPQNLAGMFSTTSSSLQRKGLPLKIFNSTTNRPCKSSPENCTGMQDVATHSYEIDTLKFEILENFTPLSGKRRQSNLTTSTAMPTNNQIHCPGALSFPGQPSGNVRAGQLRGRTFYPSASKPYSRPRKDNDKNASKMPTNHKSHYPAQSISQPILQIRSISRHRSKSPDCSRPGDMKYSQIKHFLLSLTGEVISLNKDKRTDFKVAVWSLIHELKKEQKSKPNIVT